MNWIQDVDDFWFEELGPKDWFGGVDAVDAVIRDRFADLHRAMKAAPPVPEALDGPGHVAAVIVFDQFPRNMYRHTADAFATDPLALALARHAVDRGLDRGLGPHRRQFLYLPFMHSEDPAMQEMSMTLYSQLGDPQVLDFARQHKSVIDRFGRFPGRNRALERASTKAELDYLAAPPSWA